MKKILLVLTVAISCIVFSSCKDKECTCTYTDPEDGTWSEVWTMDELRSEFRKSDAKKCTEFNETYGPSYKFECKAK